MNDRYEIGRKLGQGGVGVVHKAFDTKLQRHVALKRLLLDKSKVNDDAKAALEKEASIISSLQNPHIVTVFDAGTDDEGVFVVMELIQGQTLDKIVKRAALQQDDFIEVVEQSLEGLIAAQDVGLLHRDLKPKNIMISWLPSGSFQLKILDFGLAKFSAKPSHQTVDQSDNILGSVHFMAPEQFERKPLDPRTDLYALGCVFYFALAQKFPFRGETPAEVMSSHLNHFVKPIDRIRKDINPGYCQWIMRLISQRAQDRPPDARTALEEFQSVDTVPVATDVQPATGTPIATIIPELENSTTTSVVNPTGSFSAVETGSTPISAQVHTITEAQHGTKRQKALIFGALAIVLVAALVAFAAFRNSSAPRPDAGPVIPPLPMGQYRVAHFAADFGVSTGEKNVTPAPGDRVSIWRDASAEVSGVNILEQFAENDDLKPTYSTAGKNIGLNRTHPVIRFRKGETLVASRTGGSIGEGFEGALDGDQLTYFIVFKPGAQSKEHRVLSIDQQGYSNACVTWYRQKAYKSGVRRKGVPDKLSSAPCNLRSFVLLTFVWDGINREQFQAITVPDGTRVPGSLEKVKIDGAKILRLRIGGDRTAGTKPNNQFAGDIAELIVYNKALSTRDVKAVETYLYKKYFGF